MAAHAERVTDLVAARCLRPGRAAAARTRRRRRAGSRGPGSATSRRTRGVAARTRHESPHVRRAVHAHVGVGLGGALAEEADLEIGVARPAAPTRSARRPRARAPRSRAPARPPRRSAPVARARPRPRRRRGRAAARSKPRAACPPAASDRTRAGAPAPAARPNQPASRDHMLSGRAGTVVHHERQVVRLEQLRVGRRERRRSRRGCERRAAALPARRRSRARTRAAWPAAQRRAAPPAGSAHRRRRTARSISRSFSRSFTTSRLSTVFRPRASPSSTFARPFFQYSESGTSVKPRSASLPASRRISRAVEQQAAVAARVGVVAARLLVGRDVQVHAGTPRRAARWRRRRRGSRGPRAATSPRGRAARCRPRTSRGSRTRSARGGWSR